MTRPSTLQILPEYPGPGAEIAGVGRGGHGLCRGLASNGDRVAVITNSCGGAQDDVHLDGVHVHRIAWPGAPRPSGGIGEVCQWAGAVVARLLERRDAFRDVDLVVGHDWLTAVAAREAARLLGKPLVVTVHDEVVGKNLGRLDARGRFVAELEALTVHDATHVIANSEYTARQVVRHYGVDPSRVTAIPLGIDPTLLDVDHPEHLRDVRAALCGPDELLAVYFGRLDPEKGLGVLTDAMAQVRQARGDVRLVLAGKGGLQAPLLERLGPQDRHVGYVKGQALGYLLRAADLVIVPSVYEPFGLVTLEAMAAGASVVTSSAGGLAEIVRPGEDGLVVPPGDAAALADAVLRLAASPGLRRRLGRAASVRARREFTWAEIARRMGEVYRRVHEGEPALCVRPPERPAPPPVSVVLLTEDAPVHAEAALRSLLARTTYPRFELRVLEHGRDPEVFQRLGTLVTGLGAAGTRVTLERLPGATREAARAHALATAAHARVALVTDEVEVLAGSEDWLEGLVWLLDDAGAERVGPTLVGRAAAARPTGPTLDVEPRRRALDPACELVRVSPVARIDGATWTHPVRLLRARRERDGAGVAREAELPASIVIVAYDGLELTRAAVEAVIRHTPAAYELVLVDNGSKDGTLHLFREARERLGGAVPVQVLELGANLGYPVGANRGVAVARGRHVVLLNNDTRVRAGWLEALLAAATDGERVGVVTAKVLDVGDLAVQSAGGIEHDLHGGHEIPGQGEDRLAPTVTARRRVRNAGGPCLLLTRALLDRLAPDGRVFHEAFSPGYFEDSDLCLRARQAGFELVYEPGAELLHHGKATARLVAREGQLDVWGRFEANQRLFLERWGPQIEADLAERRAETAPPPRRRVLLCYHRSATTTAAYCEAALRRAHAVVTAGRGQELDLGDDATAEALVHAAAERLGGPVDLLLVVEGETFVPRALEQAPCRTVLWAIDTHLHAQKEDDLLLVLAPRFDRVFVAQKDHVGAFTRRGVAASWLPLACDPDVHRRLPPPGGRDLDVVFVGHLRPFHERRRRLLERLSRRFRVAVHEGVWREDMGRLFARAKVVWNCSLAGDLNMRVFEGLASGGLVVTDRIGNGLGDLFADREHLRLYDDADLEEVVAQALADAGAREAIGARGQALALRHHTYDARTNALVREALAGPAPDARRVHLTTPYGCLGDRLSFVAAAREYARRHSALDVTTDVLPEVVGAWDDGLVATAPACAPGRRTLVSAPVARHRVKGGSPDRTYVGTYAAGLGLRVTEPLPPELPPLEPPAGLEPGAYVALQPLAGSAGNPPALAAFLQALVVACRRARPGWPIVLLGRPGDAPRELLAQLRLDAGAVDGGPLELARRVQHAGLVLTPRSASAHAAAACGVPTFLWLPDDGEDWHLDYPDWPTSRVTHATAPEAAAAALVAFLGELAQLPASARARELQEASS
ncbi:MAG: glycosyltransferase [Planctomycetes bacterium]|nr:glycosyltransferase [Planctomycetota bacterium]